MTAKATSHKALRRLWGILLLPALLLSSGCAATPVNQSPAVTLPISTPQPADLPILDWEVPSASESDPLRHAEFDAEIEPEDLTFDDFTAEDPPLLPLPENVPEAYPDYALTTSLSSYAPLQGQLIGFCLTGMRPSATYDLVSSHMEGAIPLFEVGDRLVALIQVVPETRAGAHTLTLREAVGGQRRVVDEIGFTVQSVSFTRQDIEVSGELSSIATDENYAADNRKIGAAKANTSPMPLWEGLFIQPVEGRISTQYGQTRYTNGRFTSRHSALDIAAPEGAPVAAAAAGRVVLADDLIVSGKTVIIDHGLWLFTTYSHLSDISVSPGDSVSVGDLIGAVGETGYATGPHLHYAASVKAARVNPDLLKEHNPIDFLVWAASSP